VGQTTADFWVLNYNSDGEFSKYPSDYCGGSLGDETVFWYVAGFNRNALLNGMGGGNPVFGPVPVSVGSQVNGGF